MSKRKAMITALKAALVAGSPGVPVSYWRDVKASNDPQINFRDIGATNTRAGVQHEHAVKVEIESLVVGESLGDLMNDELDRLISLVGENSVFASAPGIVKELEGSGFDIIGEGMDVGIVTLVLTLSFRVTAWSGS